MVAAPRLIERLRRGHQSLVAPVVLILLTSGLVIAGLLYIAARAQDRAAISASAQFADVTLQSIHRELGRVAKDYTWWDDPIESLLLRFDPQWADDNIGWYLSDNFGTDLALVLSGNDQVIYAAVAGVAEQDFDLKRIGTGFNAILQEVRSNRGHEPVPATGFILVDEDIHFAAISPYVSKYEDRPPQTPDPDAALLLTKRLDGELLAQISTDYRLRDLRMTAPDWPRTRASLALRSADGTVLGVATWNPELPGQNLLASALPGLAGAVLVTIGLLRLFLGRSKQAEDALRESQERFRLMAETIREVFWIRDQDTNRVEFISAAASEIWGVSPETLYAEPRKFMDAIHPDDRDRVAKAFPRQLEGQYDEEYRIIHPDGAQRWIRDRAFPVRDTEGHIHLVVGLAEDITQRKRMEEELRSTSETLEAILRASPIALNALDLEGRVLRWSPSAEALFGWSEDEVLGKPAPFVPEIEKEKFDEILSKMSNGEIITGLEVRRRRKDGTLLDISLSVAPLHDAAGRIIGGVGLLEDITRRKALEDRLRHVQKLEAVGQLTAGVAHEFNNILQGAAGYLEILEDEIGDNEELRKLVAGASHAIWRGAEITKGLLAFGRRQVLRPRSIDLNDVLSRMSALLGSTSGGSVETKLTLAEDLWAAKVDPGQLETAVVNLALNARDAMPGGGTLIIETANTHVDGDLAAEIAEARPGDYVKLSVSDTGGGMSAEVLEHAFEPFFTTKDVGEGTGLGLSMIYGFAQQSNGFVSIDSELGRGTRVELYLPRVSKPVDRGAMN